MNPSDDPAASASDERIFAAEHAFMDVLRNRPRRTPAEVSEATPVACRVLGQTSIIHRLRSLAMPDLSSCRRIAGRALLGAGLLALPLTASITYAAAEAAVQASEPTPPAPSADFIVERHVIGDRTAAPDGERKVGEPVSRDAEGGERRVRMVVRGGPDSLVFSRLMGGEHYY